MKIFDEPGIARKLCKCGKFIPARSSYCGNCGYEYIIGAKEKAMSKKEVDLSQGGRGKKQCPKCGSYIGARYLGVCKTEGCEHDFSVKQTVSTKDKPRGEPEKESVNLARIIGFSGDVILIPSGECPFNPRSTEEEDINDWCNLVVMNGLAQGKLYGVKALKYFLRESVDINDDNYKNVVSYVDTWYYKMLERV